MSEPINPMVTDNGTTKTEDDFTLRDLFAAAALAGLWANQSLVMDSEDAAVSAYLSADAMLAERSKS